MTYRAYLFINPELAAVVVASHNAAADRLGIPFKYRRRHVTRGERILGITFRMSGWVVERCRMSGMVSGLVWWEPCRLIFQAARQT